MKLLRLQLILCFLFMGTIGIYAQNNSKYSSYSKSRSNSIDRQAITKALNHAKSIYKDSLSRALLMVESNLILAIENDFVPEQALAYGILGEFNQYAGNYKVAISNYQKSIDLKDSNQSASKKLDLNGAIGNSYMALNDYSKAIQYWNKSLELSITLNKSAQKQQYLLKLGDAYLKTGNLDNAEAKYKEALLTANKEKDNQTIVNCNLGLGKVEEKRNNTKAAENYFNRASKLAVKIESDELANSSMNSLSNLYENTNSTAQQIEVQEQAYSYNVNRSNTKAAMVNQSNIANSYLDLGVEDAAVEILEESAEIIKKEGNSPEKRMFVKTLSDAYEKSGEVGKAAELLTEYDMLVDSFKMLEGQKEELIAARNNLINSTENKILLLEKDRELNNKTIELLQEQQATKNEAIKRQKTITYFLLFGLLIILIMAFFIYRNNKQKQESNQLLTLKSLRNQMNPHFIFNSLNSVNTFIASKDERSANKYLSEFSKLMREVLEYSQDDFIPLKKEIDILELYLNLEHYRFKDVFDFTLTIDPAIELEHYQIPPMLLQPFVENAIWHGLRYRKSKGHLNISFKNESNYVLIEIIDDGIGRTASKALKTENQKKMKSTGLKNVEDRLTLIQDIFKKKLNIDIEDLNADGSGTVIKVQLHA